MKIKLPTKKGDPNTNPELEVNHLVVIGANGSGKTRFGSYIEATYLKQTHRISAQKSLSFPTEVQSTSHERAEREFLFGSYIPNWTREQNLNQKIGSRWSGNFNTSLLSDYDKLLTLLHTDEFEESLNFKEGRRDKPLTKLDRIQKIWESVLSHRKLFKKAGVIETYPTGSDQLRYNASEMSDGERVIFYLIGEVVCAPPNSIIIIDEPEMHIHNSLRKVLFDSIENERPDCSFVYLTHDVDFAFSRQGAIKIWTKSYEDKSIWDYEILDDNMPIPEQLYLEVLGSRKPILFLEGDNSSIDYKLYEQVYPNYTLKPLGSCEKVMHCVKSFNEQSAFHHINSIGIIDRDRIPDSEMPKFNSKGIWVLDVSEAENLLLLEDVIKIVSTYLGKEPETVFNQAKTNLFNFFQTQLEPQILLHFKDILRKKHLSLVDFSAKTIADTIVEIDTGYATIDKQKIFNDTKAEFENVLGAKDYAALLRLFHLKDALIPQSKVCELLGLKNKNAYLDLVLTLLKKNDETSKKISAAIDGKIIKDAK